MLLLTFLIHINEVDLSIDHENSGIRLFLFVWGGMPIAI